MKPAHILPAAVPFLFFTCLLAGCSITGITGDTVKEVPHETAKEMKVYFCAEDNCSRYLASFISSAGIYVHCALFDLRSEDVIDALVKKSRTADVKVVMDNQNNKGQLNKDWAIFDDDNQLSHNKFCVVDDKKVWTGSFNPTEKKNNRNDDNALIIYSTHLASNYKNEFDELWNRQFGKGGAVEYPLVYINDKRFQNYFCPDDGCRDHVIEELQKAKKAIWFMTFSFTDEGIADTLLVSDAKNIKGVFDKTQAAGQYSQYKRLKGFGLNVKLDKNPVFMHHKVFIIDNRTVITGSYNPTSAGDHKNDENIVIIEDEKIAKEYLGEFERVWGES